MQLLNDELLLNEISYSFNNKELLLEAMTHRSFSYENNLKYNNERLEFLGDAILELIISEWLFSNLGVKLSEGKMTSIRSLIVREESLAKIAQNIHIDKVIRLGKGEEQGGGRHRASILSDALEALIAAIYLDIKCNINRRINDASSFNAFSRIYQIAFPLFQETVDLAVRGKLIYDYKSSLLEKLQEKESVESITFKELSKSGPDHCPIFTMGIYYHGKLISMAKGKSKKEAEQEAAKLAIDKL